MGNRYWSRMFAHPIGGPGVNMRHFMNQYYKPNMNMVILYRLRLDEQICGSDWSQGPAINN